MVCDSNVTDGEISSTVGLFLIFVIFVLLAVVPSWIISLRVVLYVLRVYVHALVCSVVCLEGEKRRCEVLPGFCRGAWSVVMTGWTWERSGMYVVSVCDM